MLDRVLADPRFFGALVRGHPQHTRRVEFARMLRHLCRQDGHEFAGHRKLRSPPEGIRRLGVILELGVIQESQVVVELPMVGIMLDSIFYELERGPWQARSAGWFRSQKVGPELVCR